MVKPAVIFFLLAAVALGTYYFVKPSKTVVVKTYIVAQGLVKETVANTRVGTIKACRRAYLAPATGGQVARLLVSEGDKVKQGQVLLEVWNEDLKAQVDLQAAQVNAKKAVAEQVCYLAAGAERDAQRLRKLQKHDRIVSENEVDDAITEAKAKRAFCRSAKAGVRVSEANLEVSRAAMKRTLVIAPFDGTVAEINAELGEFVTPSPPGIPTLPAIDLLDMSCLYVSAPIDEVDAPKIRLDMSACLSLDAFPEPRCSGKVTRIAPYVLEKEKQARTVEVEVKLSDPEELLHLLPGYSADIEVLLDSKNLALRLPTAAVLENNRVLVMEADGLLVERSFKPGLSNWNYIEVLSGLSAGEKVVLSVGREGVVAGAYAREERL